MAKKKPAASPEAKAALDMVDAYVKEFMAQVGDGSTYGKTLATFPTGRAILAADRATQADVVEALMDRRLAWEDEHKTYLRTGNKALDARDDPAWQRLWNRQCILHDALEELLRRKLPLSEARLIRLAEWPFKDKQGLSLYGHCLLGLTTSVEHFAKENKVSERLRGLLNRLAEDLRKDHYFKQSRKLADRLQGVLGEERKVEIRPGEPWSNAVLADLKKMKAATRRAWEALLLHCQTGGAKSLSERWRTEAQPLIDAVGFDSLKQHALRWFPLVDKEPPDAEAHHHDLVFAPHVELLRGLAWCCGLKEDADLARALARLALSAYRKVPGKGPRLVGVGNACVTALGVMPGRAPIAQLALLKVKIKFGTAQNEIEKAFNASARREGLPREEIEELATPSYGLEEVGVLRRSFGDYEAELLVDGSSARLHWSKGGTPVKSVPAVVKKEHSEEVKELQTAVKDVNAMLPAQRERIDTFFLARKTWPLSVWRERYLDHPLLGTIARRLIWSFATRGKAADGVWHGGELVGVNGKPLRLKGDPTVSLWHPIGRSTDEVLAWRDFLERHEVVQPFKQAHREVYVLTDAERRTGTYSNRFAAHVLKQHQFHALCAARGWKDRLRLMVDASYSAPHRPLPEWGLRAEFWVEGVGAEYGRDTTDSGAYLYLSTDQVRFYPTDAGQMVVHARGGGYRAGYGRTADRPLPLEQVPPLVFSEIMRDVDLFVGVASVGNDPNWSDGGPGGRYRDYWQSYSFGELSATARTRKALLERLVPRLKISDRCSFADRFLVVRGDLRTYKIHLGSGNILMAPNDQYLCIVPKQTVAEGERVYLPFEGDGTLSVILSKAFLLADDARITDPTITRQIRP